MLDPVTMRRAWCVVVATFVAPRYAADATSDLVAFMPALLHLPDALFMHPHSDPSAIHAAGWKRKGMVPNWMDLKEALTDYRSRYLPAAPSLPAPRIPDRPEPTQEAIDYVTNLLAVHRQEVAQREIERLEREPAVRLPDVTLKGEALRRSREARGIRPLPQSAVPGREDA